MEIGLWRLEEVEFGVLAGCPALVELAVGV